MLSLHNLNLQRLGSAQVLKILSFKKVKEKKVLSDLVITEINGLDLVLPFNR